MDNVIRTAGILAFQDGKVLLVRHGKKAQHLDDTYGIPAGRIQPNEDAIDTAVREFNEESGLTSSAEHLTKLPTTYTAKIERKDGVKTFSLEAFLCRKYGGELKSTDEAIPEWVSMEDLEGLKLLPNMKAVIMEASKLEQNN
jgi:ADP-ribose pyrophosphatase YjhB (NUDIX family)